ncbi:DciA family protein [Streptomyces sp. H39-C1]|uniref:DciA family protein n=1 Tax=Streptomyces sp. H39-C1 TaxID=3004355 RepID=UPI003FA6FB20
MPLNRPAWFSAMNIWWLPAVGEDIAARVTPLGVDEHRRLHLACNIVAWRTQLRLLHEPLLIRIKTHIPDQGMSELCIVPHPGTQG